MATFPLLYNVKGIVEIWLEVCGNIIYNMVFLCAIKVSCVMSTQFKVLAEGKVLFLLALMKTQHMH